ncbi:MAG: NUDIX hydrolase [Sulfobacillus benefaciens]|uniref:NUDIX hydrolase n=1 Tax=Sulfobacillus benefaciens TaxID=453960 RepID=A0A2T2XI68_9FIRM|nr:MAG: NUDIX hydrolase [Sulfobacillus benefaciens]
MPISAYLRNLRKLIGHQLILSPAVAAIIRNQGGNILVLRRSDTQEWSLPAGAVDPGETPSEAIAREVLEETGLFVNPSRVLGVFGGPDFRVQYPNKDQVEYLVVLFACEVTGGQLSPMDGEAIEFRYVPVDQIGALLGLPYPTAVFSVSSSICWN